MNPVPVKSLASLPQLLQQVQTISYQLTSLLSLRVGFGGV
jgi:hypothetical protein